MNLILKNPLAFFDIEATGLDITNDRILEIAIVKLMPNGERQVYQKRVNPEIPIPLESSLIHGIYEEHVRDAPVFRSIAREVVNFLSDCDLAGYNIIKFDLPFLVENLLRENIEFNPEKKKIVDIQKIFHVMEKRNLKAAYKFYCDKQLENAHSALADAEATLEILSAQVQRYLGETVLKSDDTILGKIENNIDSLHTISEMPSIDYAGRMIYDQRKVAIFNFGKYKGKSVLETIQRDPSYYNWIIQGYFPLDTKRKLTAIKLSK